MNQKRTGRPSSPEQVIKGIKRKTRKQYNAEEKIRIVLDGLRGEDSIAELCRREGIAQSLYYTSRDVTETLELALQASGCDQADVVQKPRLLSDNGSSYISGELAD